MNRAKWLNSLEKIKMKRFSENKKTGKVEYHTVTYRLTGKVIQHTWDSLVEAIGPGGQKTWLPGGPTGKVIQ